MVFLSELLYTCQVAAKPEVVSLAVSRSEAVGLAHCLSHVALSTAKSSRPVVPVSWYIQGNSPQLRRLGFA